MVNVRVERIHRGKDMFSVKVLRGYTEVKI